MDKGLRGYEHNLPDYVVQTLHRLLPGIILRLYN